ncbi:Hypothetical protein NocV09_00301530, partial [Nannochloropsis oceanica]
RQWLAKDNIATVPYGTTQPVMTERAHESKIALGEPLSTYHTKTQTVASLEIHGVNNTGRRYLRRG